MVLVVLDVCGFAGCLVMVELGALQLNASRGVVV